MQRYSQTFDEIIERLSPINVDWKDKSAEAVIELLASFPVKASYAASDVEVILRRDFDTALTVMRLFLDMSKDEFVGVLREALPGKGIGTKQHKADSAGYVQALVDMGILDAMAKEVGRPTHWTDILVERLKSGRGSAIKGQKRGKFLEDFTETIVAKVFGVRGKQYDVRCRFTGESGLSTEKADFAIPSKQSPHILIEAKAYGATGSKLTDILGDVHRIVAQKRQDTSFLLVTDGVTWKARASDLRKLIELQNLGRIARIYTQQMETELEHDLQKLKTEYGLGEE